MLELRIELTDRLLLSGGDVSLRHFHAQIENKLALDVDKADTHAFDNMNTPEEWQSFTENKRVSKPASLMPEGLRLIAEDSSPEQEQAKRKLS